jgi:hypothetical protein
MLGEEGEDVEDPYAKWKRSFSKSGSVLDESTVGWEIN